MHFRGHLLFWFLVTSTLHAQQFTVGVGHIECINSGLQYRITKKIHGLSTAGVNLFNHNTTLCITQKFISPLFAQKFADQSGKLGCSLHISGWYYNNASNRFINLSFGPELQWIQKFSNGSLALYGGMLWNNVPYYQRKTFENVGWPNNWQPSFGARWHFKSKQK
ncbi:MAG: hypothetical protein JNL57_04575 [Bacteroidetes bacterium]|nr:hypothetical protein [Bacteroidota bacterium]